MRHPPVAHLRCPRQAASECAFAAAPADTVVPAVVLHFSWPCTLVYYVVAPAKQIKPPLKICFLSFLDPFFCRFLRMIVFIKNGPGVQEVCVLCHELGWGHDMWSHLTGRGGGPGAHP